jgi:hypothetical protein
VTSHARTSSNRRAAAPERPGLAAAVGGWSARHRKTAVLGWLLFVVLATVLGGMAGSLHTTAKDNGLGQSGRADQLIAAAGLHSPATETVLIQSSGFTATDPRFRTAVDDTIAAVKATGAASAVKSPYTNGTVAPDGHSALVVVTMAGDPDTAADRVAPVLAAVSGVQARHGELTVQEFGDASADKWFQDAFSHDFSRAEWTAVPLALGILLIAFGALVAAVLPVGLALTAIMATMGLMGLVSHIQPMSDTANSVMLLVGLAVGVDYCLFYLRREREERAKGRSPEAALQIAAATSGRAVMVSGLTVVVAMAGMFLTGIADFQAMGMATILVVITAVLGSVTVLPALLSMLGDRVMKGRVPFLGRRMLNSSTAGAEAGSAFWRAVLGRVLRRPLVSAGLATAFLLALAAPLLTMHTANLTFAQQLPKGNPLVATQQKIAAAFPGNPNQATVVVKSDQLDSPAMATALADFKSRAVATGLLHDPITVTRYPAQYIETVDVPMAGSGNDRTSSDALAARHAGPGQLRQGRRHRGRRHRSDRRFGGLQRTDDRQSAARVRLRHGLRLPADAALLPLGHGGADRARAQPSLGRRLLRSADPGLPARSGRLAAGHLGRRRDRDLGPAVPVRHPVRTEHGLPRVRGLPDQGGARPGPVHPGGGRPRHHHHGRSGHQRGGDHGGGVRGLRHPGHAVHEADGHRPGRRRPDRRDRHPRGAAALGDESAGRAQLVAAPLAGPAARAGPRRAGRGTGRAAP